ncbi:MAG: cob(I)yrinic acid a,c-diamide adenosyltransferase [Rhodospirillaceae bacterium]|jgi:cob(I)alamin adenosyltransferase|nr:cob(I)yrinic acid a,c-diamide adenosyltransferase [Rhodospirillaceae bacterium]MBT5456498.1 cob(I)yrinic acid a,c-diamide adenosyltransferase [Rhodospirillaceae bacterium]
MVKLDKIYTRGGDKGETSLGDGSRSPKASARIHAIGEIDEANATIGMVRVAAEAAGEAFQACLARIQNDLFDLGADLARPGDDPADGNLRIQDNQVTRLEREIDDLNDSLAPLTSFVLPGGTELAARLHISRTVTRRAERAVAALAAIEPVNAQALAYINRLSDLMFVMGRIANDQGRSDILWQPGMTANQ